MYQGVFPKSSPILPSVQYIAYARIQTLEDQAYTGEPLTPKPTLTYGGRTLVEGTDYTLAYSNNVKLGTATITITGKGNFEGTTTTTFEIVRKTVDISLATISPIADQVYTGEPLYPMPTLTYGGRTLVDGKDYTLAHENNTNVGYATIVIAGRGEFEGFVEVGFRIVEARWTRLSGRGRYDTMAAIVSEGFGSIRWAVIATGTNFPDALVASSLAGYRNCPVILTDSKQLSEQAHRELVRLGVDKGYVIGGTGSVPASVMDRCMHLTS